VGDFKTEHQQFTVDPGGATQRSFSAYAPYQRAALPNNPVLPNNPSVCPKSLRFK